jgi:hypothetical protein
MPQPEFVSAVRAVDWHDLESTRESGEIVLGLASRHKTEVEQAWREISETVWSR